jgi:hypothetical protein
MDEISDELLTRRNNLPFEDEFGSRSGSEISTGGTATSRLCQQVDARKQLRNPKISCMGIFGTCIVMEPLCSSRETRLEDTSGPYRAGGWDVSSCFKDINSFSSVSRFLRRVSEVDCDLVLLSSKIEGLNGSFSGLVDYWTPVVPEQRSGPVPVLRSLVHRGHLVRRSLGYHVLGP